MSLRGSRFGIRGTEFFHDAYGARIMNLVSQRFREGGSA